MKIMSALIAFLITTQKKLEGRGERNSLQFTIKISMSHRYQPHVVILTQKLVAKQNRVKNSKVYKF